MLSGNWMKIGLRGNLVAGGKLLSYGDRMVLINLVLRSLPMFMISFLEIQKGCKKDWIFIALGFFGKVIGITRNID
jgi:hypothetical protein